MKPDSAHIDVVILGGGLAGLTLALQLRGEHPELRIQVLERRAHPAPEAAFKVGESTVEIAAHYFGTVLGLRPHLDADQIVKFGFRFFFSEGRSDFDCCPELGAGRPLPTGAWQIDRGRFENFLGQRARDSDIDFITEAVVRQIELDDAGRNHRVTWEHEGTTRVSESRWVIDASGRAGLLKRQLGLAQENGHRANAAWFRVEGRIDPHDWSDDASWLTRCTPPERWRSTNHLVGPGYWVWLIPLASGSHSVGIVCDAATHPIESMKTHALAMQWLHSHQPRLAQALDDPEHRVQDFAFFRNFSYGCRQVFSPQRWALTGDAGLFLDPFYSPGSDFIAIANTYITRLVGKDLAGEAWEPYAAVYEQLYFSFYESTLVMYRDQYHLFGDPQVLPRKVLWDYTYYWGVLAALFFAGRIADLSTISRLRPELAEARALNEAMQALLGEWGRKNHSPQESPFLDQAGIDWFVELNRGLKDSLDDAAFRARLRANLQRLRAMAAELVRDARESIASIDTRAVDALLVASRQESGALLPPQWQRMA